MSTMGKVKSGSILLSLLLLFLLDGRLESQGPVTAASDSGLKVILLGTAGGPTFGAQRLGIATLVLAGPERLLFDCGRGMTTGMAALAINPQTTSSPYLNSICFPGRRAGISHCRCGGLMAPDRC